MPRRIDPGDNLLGEVEVLRVAVSEYVPWMKEIDDEVFWPARWETLDPDA